MKLLKRYWLHITVYVFMLFLYLIVLNYFFNQSKSSYLKGKSIELQNTYEKVQETYRVPARIYFNSMINNNNVLQLYSGIYDSDSLEQVVIRDSLYGLLLKSYEEIKLFNYRQLHFHLTDNTSFLRFHRPKKYGDDLTNFRATVRDANKNKVNTQGFEEGRIFNGFRYVFPMTYHNKHIGTIEVSVSFRAIVDKIEYRDDLICDFVISKSEVKEKVFRDEQNNYSDCTISDNFLSDKDGLSEIRAKRINTVQLSKLMSIASKNANLIKMMDSFELGAVVIKYANNYFLISVLPIKNYSNKNVALIISYQSDTFFSRLLIRYVWYAVIGSVVMLFLLSFIMHLYFSRENELKKNKKIEMLLEELRSQNNRLEESKLILLSKNDELNDYVATKDKFFSIISHDLKNPFHAIIGLSSILLENYKTYDETKRLSLVKNVCDVSKNTYDLLENLLTWSRSQTGKIKYSPKQVDFKKIVEKVYKVMNLVAKNKNISFVNYVNSPIVVFVDSDIIEVVVRNLVSNAIKFTPKGGEVSISCNERYSDEFVEISVTDSGVGMSLDVVDKLFRIDKQITTEGTENENGTGLGLILCKEFVELHGGKIEVESKFGEGTLLKFTIKKG